MPGVVQKQIFPDVIYRFSGYNVVIIIHCYTFSLKTIQTTNRKS